MRRVAIVGAGPSGLYAAGQLATQTDVEVAVDIYDRLPTPFGLLRYGVAPDHESVKSVAKTLAAAFDSPHVRYFGLVEVGTQVRPAQLLECYDAVIYAYGSENDRKLGIPGETELDGSRSAREFVSWYSGHPDAHAQDLDTVRNAVVVGVGNVAVDVTRILLKDPEELSVTDMPESVLAELRRTHVENVWLVGRRGPENASFTNKELRELLELDGVDTELVGADLTAIEVDLLDRKARSNVESIAAAIAEPKQGKRHLHLVFNHRPVAIKGVEGVTGVEFESNLDGSHFEVPADLVLRSIGYFGNPLPGVPFADGRIPNLEGRVTEEDGSSRPGEYVTGWIKRGPSGLIGANRKDSAETVAHLVADLQQMPQRVLADPEELMVERGIKASSLADWRRIDEAEIARGDLRGRERTKIEAWHDLLDLVFAEQEEAVS
ncbi:MAG TPA: ferredoxin-NADP reductase [Propionibacteriaceae bacterium]|nr:ferredoxin-NADP reductase [Propionibacteriaceae bacterium]